MSARGTTPQPTHDLPSRPDEEYVAHIEKLDVLDMYMEARPTTRNVLAVAGMAGVGKTRFVLEYAYRSQHEYEVIAWIPAVDRGVKAVLETLEGRLGLSSAGSSDSLEERARRIREVLEGNQQILVVVDDLRDERLLEGWLPRTGAAVLVTSQAPLSTSSSIGRLVLGPSSEDEARRLLLGHEALTKGSRSRDLFALAGSLADAEIPARWLRSALGILRGEDVDPDVFDQVHEQALSDGLVSKFEPDAPIRLVPQVWAVARDLSTDRHRLAVCHAVAEEVRGVQHGALSFGALGGHWSPHIGHLVADVAPGVTDDELVLAREWAIDLRYKKEYERALAWCEGIVSWAEGASRATFLLEASEVLAEQGRLSDAFERCREASSIVEGLEGSEVLRSEVSRARGRILTRQRRFDEARSSHERSLSVIRAAVVRAPEDQQVLREWSFALVEYGELLIREGGVGEALESFEQSHGILDRFFDRFPESLDVRRELCVVLGKIGGARLALREVDEALGAYAQSVEHARELVSRAPRSEQCLIDLSNALADMGDAHRRKGSFDRAEQAYEDGLEVARRLTWTTLDGRAALYFASFLRRYGDLSLERGSTDAALRVYHRSVYLARRLIGADVAVTEARHDLAVSLGRVGGFSILQGDVPAAVRAYTESLDLTRQLALDDPTNVRTQYEWIQTSRMLGDAHQRAGDYSTALDVYDEGLTIARRRVEDDRCRPEDVRLLSDYLEEVRDLMQRVGQAESADELRREQLELASRIGEPSS